ncbi:hypothetical protein [Rhizobium sp. 11515TR]|nr:hypothetical protein [Rhizobium sp. 11515TR]
MFDADSEQAKATKIAVLDMVSNDGFWSPELHFNMPGFGSIRRGPNDTNS